MSTAYGAGPTGLSGTHYGGPGLGVRGDQVPSTGMNGPPPLYDLLTLPADAAKEFMFRVTAVPVGLTFFNAAENGAMQAEGPDGPRVGAFSLYQNGVLLGSDAFTLYFGPQPELAGGAQMDGVVASGGIAGVPPSSGNLTGSAALDGVAAGGGIAGVPPSSGNVTGNANLDDVAAAGGLAGVPPNTGTLAGNATLDDAAAGGGLVGGTPASANLGGAATLDDASASGGITGSLPPAVLGGDATLDDAGASGGMVGRVLPTAAQLGATGGSAQRVVPSGTQTPKWLRAFDVDEVADIYFNFARSLLAGDQVVDVAVTCEARVGVDAAAGAMRVGQPSVQGAIGVQRFQAGLPGVVYLVRATATLQDGRKPVAAAFMRVERQR